MHDPNRGMFRACTTPQHALEEGATYHRAMARLGALGIRGRRLGGLRGLTRLGPGCSLLGQGRGGRRLDDSGRRRRVDCSERLDGDFLTCAPGRSHMVNRMQAAAHISEGADGSVERLRLRLQTLLHDSAGSFLLRGTFLQRGNLRFRSIL